MNTIINLIQLKVFMKKILLLVMAVLGVQGIQAQNDVEFGIFDHLGAGLSVGTDGIGIDVSSCLTDYVGIRAGVSFLPGIKIKKNISINNDGDSNTYYDNVDAQFKVNKFDFKLLFDFYPIQTSSFHVTAGAYIGTSKLIGVTNKTPILKDPNDYGTAGLKLGNYYVSTDDNGNVDINVKVNGFKPYLGIGIGRAVPKKSQLAVSADLGVQFWGKPGIYTMAADSKIKLAQGIKEEHKFTKSDLDDQKDGDWKDAFDIMEKFSVYPVLNVRLTGRIF